MTLDSWLRGRGHCSGNVLASHSGPVVACQSLGSRLSAAGKLAKWIRKSIMHIGEGHRFSLKELRRENESECSFQLAVLRAIH